MSYESLIQGVSIRHTDTINKACRHLFHNFNMNHFWYCKIDNQGNYSFLGSHVGWSEFFASEKLYLKYSLLKHPDQHKSSVNLIKSPQDPLLMDVMSSCKIRFNMQCLLSVINKDESGIEEFGFASCSANDAQISLLMNELPLLRLFVKNFLKEHPLLLSKLEDNQVNMGTLIGPSFYEPFDEKPSMFDKQSFLRKMHLGPDLSLTPREIEVLRLLMEGFSAGQISTRVFRSPRTVEHRIERLKEKLSCFSKPELVQKARELDEFGFFS